MAVLAIKMQSLKLDYFSFPFNDRNAARSKRGQNWRRKHERNNKIFGNVLQCLSTQWHCGKKRGVTGMRLLPCRNNHSSSSLVLMKAFLLVIDKMHRPCKVRMSEADDAVGTSSQSVVADSLLTGSGSSCRSSAPLKQIPGAWRLLAVLQIEGCVICWRHQFLQ